MAATPSEFRTSPATRKWVRDQRLERLGYCSYADYTSSPEWAKVKARYRASGLPQDCVICGGSSEVMHHKTYERVGAERIEDLAPLCWACHGLVHALDGRGDLGLDFDGLVSAIRAERYEGQRLRVKPDESWDAVHREERDRIETRSRSQRLRNAMLDLWRSGKEESYRRHVAKIDEVIATMQEEARP